MSKLFSLFASLLLVCTAQAAPPVPKDLEPKLDPVKAAVVATCNHQLAFVVVVFEDGTVTIYDKQSGVPAETALYTASKAKSVKGYEVCSTDRPGTKVPGTTL